MGRFLLLIGAVVPPAAAVLVVLLAQHATGAGAPSTAERPAPGCRVIASVDGYPASYIAQPVTYRLHPPLPVSGWRAPAGALRFQVLFHSVFHGYLVITYPPDLPAEARAQLRRWVSSRRRDRVVATPTRVPGTAWIDVAEWGWELRCEGTVPTSAELDRFAARRSA